MEDHSHSEPAAAAFDFSSSDSALHDLCASHTMEVDVSLEWLSAFMEECLSSNGSCLPPPPSTTQPSSSETEPEKPQHHFSVPGKARSKRRKRTTTSNANINPFFGRWLNQLNSHHNHSLQFTTSDPLLLQQTYWLADSELVVIPQKEKNGISEAGDEKETGKEKKEKENVLDQKRTINSLEMQQPAMGRRCSHCLTQRTPQWRAGPLGPKTLCNACGVRYKSGRLLPEYRPAKSPTFVSYLHSNSHKRVMEMRMTPSSP